MGSTFIFIAIVVVVLFSIIVSAFSKKAIVKRKLRNTPSKTIVDYQNGEIAKIVGKANYIKEPLIAPLSSRECVYYYVKVEKKVSSGKNSHWQKIIEEELHYDFKVDDETGSAIVKSDFIKSYLVVDARYRSGFLEDATSQLENYLHHHGHDSIGLLGMNKTLRYQEAVLEIGEDVAIAGIGNWREGTDGKKILEISGSEEFPVFLSDDPATMEFVKAKPEKDLKKTIKKLEKKDRRRNERRSRYTKSYK